MEKLLKMFRSTNHPNNTSVNVKSLILIAINSNGRMARLKIFSNFTAADVLKVALAEFSSKHLNYKEYKLLHIGSGKIIFHNTSMDSAGVSNYDEVCLIMQHEMLKNEVPLIRAPSQTTIDKKTGNVQNSRPYFNPHAKSLKLTVAGLSYIRNFLIQMAMESAYVISSGPHADFLIEYFKQKIVGRRRHHDDAMKSLTEMGFERTRCLYAMKLKKNIYADALHWLIDHSSDSNIYRPYNSSISLIGTLAENSQEKYQRLLQIIRIYGRSGQLYCENLLTVFSEMGFDKDESLKALKSCDWDPISAIDILCGEPASGLLSLGSPILRNVLESSEVQKCLGNPEIFMTIIYVLGSGKGSSGLEHNWESAKEIYNQVASILKVYNDEKHYNVINNIN